MYVFIICRDQGEPKENELKAGRQFGKEVLRDEFPQRNRMRMKMI